MSHNYTAIRKSEFHIILFLFILNFILRFFSFFPTLIDHDESTNLVIAKKILKGKVLYTDMIDIKPFKIFYIAAAYLKLFGNSISVFRILAAVIIALTVFLLYKTKLNIGHTKNFAIASAAIHNFFCLFWHAMVLL